MTMDWLKPIIEKLSIHNFLFSLLIASLACLLLRSKSILFTGLIGLITFCLTYLLWDLFCKLIKWLNRRKNKCALNQHVKNETQKIYFDLSEKDLKDIFHILSFEKDPRNKYDRILRYPNKVRIDSNILSSAVVRNIPGLNNYDLIKCEQQQNSQRFIFNSYFYKLLMSGKRK